MVKIIEEPISYKKKVEQITFKGKRETLLKGNNKNV